jgi:hypothetical protein
MDVISILIGFVVGAVFAKLGGFWFYVGAIIGFVSFRKVSLWLKASRVGCAEVRNVEGAPKGARR